MNMDGKLIERLEQIPWFSCCGNPVSFSWALSAGSPSAALKAISSVRWENMVLDQRGDFTEQLSIRAAKGLGHEEREWNKLVGEFKEKYLPGLRDQWEKGLDWIALNRKEVLDDIAFNILAIATLDAYKDILPMPQFFQRMLEIYQSGFLPCGWKGTKEKGCFVVF